MGSANRIRLGSGEYCGHNIVATMELLADVAKICGMKR